MFPTTNDLRGQLRLCVALALTTCIGILGANAATASFTDVPPENRFAESVTRVQESGIATGFPDGTFRGTDDLTRQQAAAWLDRSASRVGLDINGGLPVGPTLTAAQPSATVATLEMTSPAASTGGGWVTVQGGVGGVALESGATCPCPIGIEVLDEDDVLVARGRLVAYADPTGAAFAVGPIIGVTPIAGGESKTFRVVATLLDTTDPVLVGAAVYIEYSPMVEGEPAIAESSGTDPVESMVPQLP